MEGQPVDLKQAIADKLLQLEQPRDYIGMSGIGHPCERRLWLDFHQPIPRKLDFESYLKINDGHRHEDVMAEWLGMVDGVDLTHRGHEVGYGSFRGHIDGVITIDGVSYIWEHKQVNDAKFKAFERRPLREWDGIYYAQAQCYMHFTNIPRHLLSCGSAGLRDFAFKVTEYEGAEEFIAKAEAIEAMQDMPKGLYKGHYMCNWCNRKSFCWPDNGVF